MSFAYVIGLFSNCQFGILIYNRSQRKCFTFFVLQSVLVFIDDSNMINVSIEVTFFFGMCF